MPETMSVEPSVCSDWGWPSQVSSFVIAVECERVAARAFAVMVDLRQAIR